MGMKKVYSCDICNEQTEPNKLIGCNFSGMKKFKLDAPRTTDGTHICFECIEQLREQIPKVKFANNMLIMEHT